VKLLRSWPAVVPPGRSHVIDGVERLVVTNYDYSPLVDVGDDVLLLEWDVAVDMPALDTFAEHAMADPGRVLAAPYRLYPGCSLRDPKMTRPVWSAWRYRRTQQDGGMVEVAPGDPAAHIVGFGMTYLPADLLRKYHDIRDPSWGFSDISFCGWHYREISHDIALDWDARPVHLHYPTPTIGAGDD